MRSSDVEDERLELHYRVVRGETADATEETCGGHAAVNSCSAEVNGSTGKAGPMGSGRGEAGQQWVQDGGQHDPALEWMEEGEQPRKKGFSPESPATEDLVEQGEMLHIQDGVLQQGMEDPATHKRLWLLVNPFSLQAELLKEEHADISGGRLGRRKTLCRLCWIGTGQEVEWCCKLYHVSVAKKESGRRTSSAPPGRGWRWISRGHWRVNPEVTAVDIVKPAGRP